MVILILFSMGCSNNLTKDKAKELILAAKKYPYKQIGVVEISQNSRKGVKISKEKMPNYIKMMSNKLILMNILAIDSNGNEYYDVKLTNEGKKCVLQQKKVNNKLLIDVLLGQLIFDKIITIRQYSYGKGYNVIFSEELNRITPFSICLIDKPIYERTVHLVLHKGKWRIN